MVADDTASRAIWLGEAGALVGAQPGTLLIESSTLSTGWVRELAGLTQERGCSFLDAPVTGSKPQAEAGELIFLVGGEASDIERARPVLEAMGRRIEHFGPTGSGATMKLINNLMGGVQIAVLAEGLLLAEQAGLNMEKVVPLLINGAPGSPIVKGKAARIVARDYNTHFALRWMHKDLSYALEEAMHQTVSMPTVAAAREVYRLAMSHGLSEEDFSAVAEALRPQ
jgi:3-hydroxyisobutyrate dehydrogenase